MCQYCEKTKAENRGWTDLKLKKIFDDYRNDMQQIFEEHKILRNEISQSRGFLTRLSNSLLENTEKTEKPKSFLAYLWQMPKVEKIVFIATLLVAFVGLFILFVTAHT